MSVAGNQAGGLPEPIREPDMSLQSREEGLDESRFGMLSYAKCSMFVCIDTPMPVVSALNLKGVLSSPSLRI